MRGSVSFCCSAIHRGDGALSDMAQVARPVLSLVGISRLISCPAIHRGDGALSDMAKVARPVLSLVGISRAGP
jgi:uncharacterized metal-binding protein